MDKPKFTILSSEAQGIYVGKADVIASLRYEGGIKEYWRESAFGTQNTDRIGRWGHRKESSKVL